MPGPSEPATHLPGPKESATSRAIWADFTASSWQRSGMPYSTSTHGMTPKLSVSTTSDADLEERAVEVGDDVGPGVAQHLGAALEGGAAVVVERQFAQLEVGAGGAVVDDDAVVYGLQEVALHGPKATDPR